MKIEPKASYVCDRCGATVEADEHDMMPWTWSTVYLTVTSKSVTTIGQPYDLCDKCLALYVDMSGKMAREFLKLDEK